MTNSRIRICFAITVFFTIQITVIRSWNEWNYKTTWSTDKATAASLKSQWEAIWTNSYYKGASSPPRARRGHSIHLIKTDSRSQYNGDTYVVLFGGRDNDQIDQHIPKTYNVQTVIPKIKRT
jgi:hypothetical protein